MRTIAIIQARTGSTRLPGKVLMDVAGRPMIRRVLDRASRIQGIDGIAVATPDLVEDDGLSDLVHGLGHRVVRGPAHDVLERYLLAADAMEADVVVRLTSDCPLLSPSVSSLVVERFQTGTFDYCSNTIERTWPRGLDTEVVDLRALRIAGREASTPSDREHVTPFVWRQPDRFRLESVSTLPDRSDLRWTVDTPNDLELVRRVFAGMSEDDFDLPEILDLLRREPALLHLNRDVRQKPVE